MSREQIKLAPLVVILLADQFLVYAVLYIIATLRVNAELLDLLLLLKMRTVSIQNSESKAGRIAELPSDLGSLDSIASIL